MNWIRLLILRLRSANVLRLGSAKDPELAPHMYLAYLLAWTFAVGIFVLFVFPVIGNTLGFFVIGLMIVLFVTLVWYFNQNELFAD